MAILIGYVVLKFLTLPYLSFPTTSSKSLDATPNLASTGNLQAIKIVSVPVVAVEELLYLTVCLGDALSWMLSALYPGIQCDA